MQVIMLEVAGQQVYYQTFQVNYPHG